MLNVTICLWNFVLHWAKLSVICPLRTSKQCVWHSELRHLLLMFLRLHHSSRSGLLQHQLLVHLSHRHRVNNLSHSNRSPSLAFSRIVTVLWSGIGSFFRPIFSWGL
jgi:hypothetical protein